MHLDLLVEAVYNRFSQFRLRGPSPSSIYSRLVNFIELRNNNPYARINSLSVMKQNPLGWNQSDEAIWMEWLQTTVFPPNWWKKELHYFYDSDRMISVLEEFHSYLPYFIERSKDKLAEIDPRHFMDEITVPDVITDPN